MKENFKLIGVLILFLLGVIGFYLIFTQDFDNA